jgi:hypothetical protein
MSCPKNVHDPLDVAVLKNGPDRQDSDQIRVSLNAALILGPISQSEGELAFAAEHLLCNQWNVTKIALSGVAAGYQKLGLRKRRGLWNGAGTYAYSPLL